MKWFVWGIVKHLRYDLSGKLDGRHEKPGVIMVVGFRALVLAIVAEMCSAILSGAAIF